MPVDHEIVQNRRSKPFTPEEIEEFQTIDPVEYELFKHRTFHILDETKQVMLKLGSNPIIRDSEEVAIGLYSVDGDLAMSATGIYLHAIGAGWSIQYTLKHRAHQPGVGINDGDQFFNNETWYGGTHPPDQVCYAPIFADGEIIAWSGCITHSSATGAMEPGGMPPSATTRFHEGLRVPCVKVIDRGVMREDVWEWIEASSDDPRCLLLDARSRIAGNNKVRTRVLELVAKYGTHFVKVALRRMIWETEQRCRAKLRKVNDGVYRETYFLDTTGQNDAIVKVEIAMTKQDDRMTFDFTGSSPVQPGPTNVTPSALIGGLFAALASQFYWEVDWNIGIMNTIDLVLPKDTIVYPRDDSAINQATCVGIALIERFRRCLGKLMFDSPFREDLTADYAAYVRIPFFGGFNQYGQPVSNLIEDVNASAQGARVDRDGEDGGGLNCVPEADGADVESWEHSGGPVLYLTRNFLPDTGGWGKFRGGNALWQAMKIHSVPWLVWGTFGSGDKMVMPIGFGGGYGAPTSAEISLTGTNFRALVERLGSDDDYEPPFYAIDDYAKSPDWEATVKQEPAMSAARELKEDDFWVHTYQGSGGLGDPLERDPQLVMLDLRRELVTTWAAEHAYKVAFDRVSLRVDEEETQRLRDEARQRRIDESISFEEYVSSLDGRKPPEELLLHYGQWP